MSDDIFGLLMLILMLENGGGTENINQMVIMFLLLQSRGGGLGNGLNAASALFGGLNNRNNNRTCGRDDGFTF